MRCAIYGMPADLTPLQEMWLELNAEIGRAIKTHTVVEGQLIASGRPGPWEYYLMLTGGDPSAAARLQARAMLNEMMGGR
jgi:hypothetical protein